MAIPLSLLKELQTQDAEKAWDSIFNYVWDICSEELSKNGTEAEVTKRDRAVGDLDLFLTSAGWDLWHSFINVVPKTSDTLKTWWTKRAENRAILILDALSLRETPWLLQGAKERGYIIHTAKATGSELPADTTPFAKALGLSQRSSLNNNGAGNAHAFIGAKTESVDIAWSDCAEMIGSESDWVFWHHWPDTQVHELKEAGKGLQLLINDAQEHLNSDGFWKLVDRLATGRRLIITADHGYAASGLFPDTSDRDQSDYLKKNYKGGRWNDTQNKLGVWVPPIDIRLGDHSFVLGRRKWKTAGGYPTLVHGGLSVLEVAVPFIEISKKA